MGFRHILARLRSSDNRQVATESRMTPAELRKLGDQYGRGWQSHLAREMRVNDRTVRRWVAGATEIHPALEKRIRQILRKRNRKEG
ncbi:hypothetical protein OJF2_51500 [Aquisphaera giovannonii]|uniref:Transcriptional regulator n=1 Tax=Aquisphaera giovannonii TaxID=406548 RepID=A0A5B9W7B3_9BACT|nr:hypothetical protein OJF2_51500 [Aquisphaera giovannonii]